MTIGIDVLFAEGQSSRSFGLYLRGAFRSDEAPEEWRLRDAVSAEEAAEIKRTPGGFWRTQDRLQQLRAS